MDRCLPTGGLDADSNVVLDLGCGGREIVTELKWFTPSVLLSCPETEGEQVFSRCEVLLGNTV